jgi:membrane protein implicated in regulation of membrane protease activity
MVQESKAEVSLEFHLTRHFAGQTVIIRINGKEAARSADTRTDMRTDRARILVCKVAAAPALVQVEVPEASARAEATIEPAEMQFIVVALDGARLRVEPVTKSDYEREPRGHG